MNGETTQPAKTRQVSGLDMFSKILVWVESSVAIIAFTLMLADVLAGVVMRYLLQVPWSWGEEASRYLMVLGIMAGLGIGVREGAHLNVEMFRAMLPRAPRLAITLVADLITAATFFFLVFVSYQFIEKNREFGQVTAALNIPIYYIYYILILGFFASGIEHLIVVYRKFAGRKEGPEASDGEREGFGI